MTSRFTQRTALFVGAPLLLALYWLSGPRSLPEADAAEFAAVALRGGIPHPPGYPLLVVVLQAFAPLGAALGLVPALALSSMLFAVAAAVLLARCAHARGADPVGACVATGAVFLSTNVWRDATNFEPFALNLLLAAALIACCHALAVRPQLAASSAVDDSARLPLAIGVLFGLGLCNHHSLATLAPLPALVLLARPSTLARRVCLALVGFALGATPLLLLLALRHQPGWVWGDWEPFLPRLTEHLLRREYGTLELTHGGGPVSYGPLRMLGTLPGALSYVFCVLLVAGLAHGVWARARTRRRQGVLGGRRQGALGDGFALGAAASFVTSGLLFPALFRLAGKPLDDLIVDRFFALPMLLLVFPLAHALTLLGPRLRAAYPVLALGLLLLHAGVQWPRAARVQHRFFEAHVRNVFDVVERGAAIMTAADGGFAAGLYGRYVLGRQDVLVIFGSISQPWYEARVARALGPGMAPAVGAGVAPRAKRPLYLLDLPAARWRTAMRVAPVGPLLRVLEPGVPIPSAEQQFASNQALFARLRLPTREQVRNADAWEADELVDYHRCWDMIGRALREQHRPELARRAFEYATLFVPSAER